VSVTVQLFSEPKGTIHLDVVRPHRPCGRRALGERDSRCAQVRTAGDTHLYHEVYRKVREDLRDLNGYDLQLIARDETARVDMCAMLEARRHPPDPTDPKPAREGFAMLGLERQHKIQPPPLGKVHVRRLGWQGMTYVRFCITVVPDGIQHSMRGISCPARGDGSRVAAAQCWMTMRGRAGQLPRRSHARYKLRGRHPGRLCLFTGSSGRSTAGVKPLSSRDLPKRFREANPAVLSVWKLPEGALFALGARRVAVHSARHRDARCSAKAEAILERIHQSFVAHGGRDVEIDPQMATIATRFSGTHFPTEHRTSARLLSMPPLSAQPRTCIFSHSRLAHMLCMCAVHVLSAMPARTAMGSTQYHECTPERF
jgi:hypothetical protein